MATVWGQGCLYPHHLPPRFAMCNAMDGLCRQAHQTNDLHGEKAPNLLVILGNVNFLPFRNVALFVSYVLMVVLNCFVDDFWNQKT